MFLIRLFHVYQLVLSWPYKSINCKNRVEPYILVEGHQHVFPSHSRECLIRPVARSMNSFLLAWFSAFFYSRSYHPLPLYHFPYYYISMQSLWLRRLIKEYKHTYVFTRTDMINPITSEMREHIRQPSHFRGISCIQDPKTSEQ